MAGKGFLVGERGGVGRTSLCTASPETRITNLTSYHQLCVMSDVMVACGMFTESKLKDTERLLEASTAFLL